MSDRRLLSVSEAAEIVLGRVRGSSGAELVSLSKANGRVLATDMFARIANPPFDRSAVDGYGIGRDDIHRPAPYALRMIGKINAGDDPSRSVSFGKHPATRRGYSIRRLHRAAWYNVGCSSHSDAGCRRSLSSDGHEQDKDIYRSFRREANLGKVSR